MGGKKTKAKAPPKKKRATVSKTFKCPYCSHEAACEVKLDRTAETGSISCRVCGENYQCRINYLSDPVDVFCEWIDACEAARTGTGGDASDDARAGAGLNHSDDRAPASTASARSSGGAGQTNDGWEADEED